MAVVNVNSTQYGKQLGPLQDNRQYWPTEGGKVRTFHFTIPALAAASDITSIFSLAKLPSGKLRILPFSSYIKCSAGGAGMTLDFGVGAYLASDGKTSVGAGGTDIVATKDVSAALPSAAGGVGSVLAGTASPIKLDYFTANGLVVTATVRGANAPIGFTLEGIISYELVQ